MTDQQRADALKTARAIVRIKITPDTQSARAGLVVRESLAHRLAEARLRGHGRAVARLERLIQECPA